MTNDLRIEPAKRRLGRPPMNPADRRTERVDVFFSLQERLKLKQDAQACGMSAAAYIRELVAGFRPSAKADHEADPKLLLELNAIGNNLGQLIKSLPSGTQNKADWVSLKRNLEDVLQVVALEGISVPPKLLMQLSSVGTLLNHAVADRHADSRRKHDWEILYETLHGLVLEIGTDYVH